MLLLNEVCRLGEEFSCPSPARTFIAPRSSVLTLRLMATGDWLAEVVTR